MVREYRSTCCSGCELYAICMFTVDSDPWMDESADRTVWTFARPCHIRLSGRDGMRGRQTDSHAGGLGHCDKSMGVLDDFETQIAFAATRRIYAKPASNVNVTPWNDVLHIGSSPSYLSGLVMAIANIQFRKRLRSADTNRYEPLTARLKFGKRCFSPAGPKAWNALPAELQDLTDHSAFKRQLKIFLFGRTFTTWVSCRWSH